MHDEERRKWAERGLDVLEGIADVAFDLLFHFAGAALKFVGYLFEVLFEFALGSFDGF